MTKKHAATLIDCGSGVRLERGVRCEVSDGTILVSDHYYPPGNGPNPTLLMRQPYGRDIASTVVYAHPIWFARHGYNVVIQDVRGRGDSEGEFYPFRHERDDGAETIRWLRTRPESNGKVGMYGFSYQGMTQLLAASAQPEGLVCIAPGMTAHDLYHGWFYHNGALRLASTFGWGLQMLREDSRRLELREASEALQAAWNNLRNEPLYAPYRHLPALLQPGLPAYVLNWFDHDEPSHYWSEMDVSQSLLQIIVPALHVAGWFDTYLKGSIDGFLALTAGAGSAPTRDHQYLIAGPWVHIPWGDMAGDQNFGSEALLDTDTILLRWFNHWLKDSSEFGKEPKIRHFALGTNTWNSADSWNTETTLELFLHSANRANSRKGTGLLSTAAPSVEEPRDVFVYDPEVPVCGPGGSASLSGPHNQAALELGNNLLVFTTAPLSAPLHVFGHPEVEIYCTTSATSADLTAKLVRVTPQGRAEFTCIGMARSSYLFRHSTYAPDTVRCWRFALEPTSCVFLAGESIRLEIAGSAFPLYDRNSSVAGVKPSLADAWSWKRSTHIVFHEPGHASLLRLPILKGAA
ncbi:MAG TPA: CocE/NonD family hydrolase [Silvibacterium sp.]|nr:CocE/NonD family hydrolase [Silvibacterium sp.]